MFRTPFLRIVKSTPDPNTFGKHRDTPPVSVVMLLQKYVLLLAESSRKTSPSFEKCNPLGFYTEKGQGTERKGVDKNGLAALRL